jgi:hypothetical protein
VVDIADITNPRFDADRFFDENHPTQGMQTLLRQIFERLCGSSPQGVFRLKQAMGGGKTHNMVAAGLLAKHPHLRRGVLGKLGIAVDNRDIAVAAFTGREGSVQEFLWLDIARQLHRSPARRRSRRWHLNVRIIARIFRGGFSHERPFPRRDCRRGME